MIAASRCLRSVSLSVFDIGGSTRTIKRIILRVFNLGSCIGSFFVIQAIFQPSVATATWPTEAVAPGL